MSLPKKGAGMSETRLINVGVSVLSGSAMTLLAGVPFRCCSAAVQDTALRDSAALNRVLWLQRLDSLSLLTALLLPLTVC
jgi:hypothetical protein